VGLDWEFSKYRQNVDARFSEPWLFGTPTELNVNVYNRFQNQIRQQFYDDRRRGAAVRVGRPVPWFDYTSGLRPVQLRADRADELLRGLSRPVAHDPMAPEDEFGGAHVAAELDGQPLPPDDWGRDRR
jgi:hypothetical protein